MSKSVRKVIGVVAAIAVPFAAPAIASAIGLSGAIGTALGSATLGSTFGGALTGAVLGGAASKLQGGKFGSGALMGGLGGGIGGYMTTPTGAPTSNLAAGATQATPGSGVLASAPGAAPTSIADMAAGLKLPAGGGVLAAPTTATATPGFLANVPGAAGMASAVTPSAANASGVLGNIASGTAQNFRTMTGIGAAPGTAAAGTASKLTPALVQGATTLAAGALSGPSAAERRMMEQQAEALRASTSANEAAYRERLNEARKLIGESAYFDPEYAGLQSARRAQIAGSRAKREGLRGMTGGERQAEARRYDLDTARTTGTAYDVGYGAGIGNRLDTRKAGLAMFPGAYPDSGSGYTSLMSAYGTAEDRAAGQAENIGKFAGDLYGAYTSQKKG